MLAGDSRRDKLTNNNIGSTARAIELVVLEDGTRCERVVGKLSACLPFLFFLDYRGPIVEKIALCVHLGADKVKSNHGRRT